MQPPSYTRFLRLGAVPAQAAGAHIRLFDLALAIARVVDLVSREVADHHTRVACIALGIARELGLPPQAEHDLVIASLLHDIGILSSEERVKVLTFDGQRIDLHAETGYQLLRKFTHFGGVAHIVRHHHAAWGLTRLPWDVRGEALGELVPRTSYILHLADRIEVLLGKGRPDAARIRQAVAAVAQAAGERFEPESVEAFARLATRQSFWEELAEPDLGAVLRGSLRDLAMELDWEELRGFSEMLAQVIDFRSRFTSTHSSGVAAVGAALAQIHGFAPSEVEKVKVAGYLHDIGKLAVPVELLEKSEPLSHSEFTLIMTHVEHTRRILEPLSHLEDVVAWASQHHERLDSGGYPEHLPGEALSAGSRIVAVADVFTALAEQRPYRGMMSRSDVVTTLRQLAAERALDGGLIALAVENYGDLDRARQQAQRAATEEYERFRQSLGAH